MSVITECSIEADGFQLGRVLSGPSAVRLELERIVPTGDQLLPFVWADGDEDDLDAFEREVRSSRYVEELTTLDRLPSARLYEVEWRPHVEGLDSTEGSIYEGRGVDDRWSGWRSMWSRSPSVNPAPYPSEGLGIRIGSTRMSGQTQQTGRIREIYPVYDCPYKQSTRP